MKTTLEIAKQLIKLLKEKKFVEAYQELFDEHVESIDPLDNSMHSLKGLQKLIDKEISFLSGVDIKNIHVSDPVCAGRYFSINMIMSFTVAGEEKKIEELCVYQIKNEKIISQQFFI